MYAPNAAETILSTRRRDGFQQQSARFLLTFSVSKNINTANIMSAFTYPENSDYCVTSQTFSSQPLVLYDPFEAEVETQCWVTLSDVNWRSTTHAIL